ncbi:hypothetical protein ACGLWX_18115 [Halomonas sp. HMF6819]|uniref:hypothetical protein n=1 Tax=Halomonas sp. HMF6819 TaxID=3373085 RepID=UPI003797C16B
MARIPWLLLRFLNKAAVPRLNSLFRAILVPDGMTLFIFSELRRFTATLVEIEKAGSGWIFAQTPGSGVRKAAHSSEVRRSGDGS